MSLQYFGGLEYARSLSLQRVPTLVGLLLSLIACGEQRIVYMDAPQRERNPSGEDDAAPPPWDAGPPPGDALVLSRPTRQPCQLPTPPAAGTLQLQEAWPEHQLQRPLWFGYAPGLDHERFVIEQGGRIMNFPAEGGPLNVFLDLEVSRRGNEEGLLGLAFHPRYAENQRFFLYYSSKNCASGGRCSKVSELRAAPDDLRRALPETERLLLEIPQPYGNHNGGDLHFGPDSYLYISLGDGGSAGDPLEHSQNEESLLGAILRVDIDGEDPRCGLPYAIPRDNPFSAAACEGEARREIWAWGLRNPWRMSFDRATGTLWAADVGQNRWEELNQIEGGGNYGWRPAEGPECFVDGCDLTRYQAPFFSYPHSVGSSVTGGFVYRGAAHPSLWGYYIYGDYEAGWIHAIDISAPPEAREPVVLSEGPHEIVSFGEDPEGELFVVTFDAGVLRLEAREMAASPSSVPTLLSETGCFAETRSGRLVDEVEPYEVRAPFWSDGAEKERAFALPVGEKIQWRARGGLELPIGSVLIKTFSLTDSTGEAQRVETRLTHKSERGWLAYSYRWLPDQSDAVLSPLREEGVYEGARGAQPWFFPSSSDCFRCHTRAANYALGFEGRQLNREIERGARREEQLTLWARAGYIDLPDAPARLPRLTDPRDEREPLDARARSYLHSNCASCHQPGGVTGVEIDLRAGTSFAESGLCETAPLQGDLDVAGAALLRPGVPAESLILLRMGRRGEGQMPPEDGGIRSLDLEGISLIESWIDSMAGCP